MYIPNVHRFCELRIEKDVGGVYTLHFKVVSEYAWLGRAG
jgi:hypothetical protein